MVLASVFHGGRAVVSSPGAASGRRWWRGGRSLARRRDRGEHTHDDVIRARASERALATTTTISRDAGRAAPRRDAARTTVFVSESRDARGGDSRLARDRSITLSCIAFSYFLRSEMPLSDELAASMTYLFWFCTFSFHCASHVTVLSCCTTPHAWPGIGQLGTLSPSPTLIVTCGDHAHSIPFHSIPFHSIP